MKKTLISFCLILVTLLGACNGSDKREEHSQNSMVEKNETLIIPGEDEVIDAEIVRKGEVLIAYSNCYECHKEENKAKGPSFQAIAKRYPMQQVYLDHLARKIISGGSGAWGYPVMEAHPHLKFEEAKMMATYILSLEEK
ncbi:MULTISPECIES: c-type cytochrome [Mariniradius]|nr:MULTISPECIES: c-type cytochrome [Mariniradius]MCF1749671.1 c-type cytochrome [Mariniradius sediminis]